MRIGRYWLAALAVALLALAPVWRVAAQHQGGAFASAAGPTFTTEASSGPTVGATVNQAPYRLNLPLVVNPLQVRVAFGTGRDATGALSGITTVFPTGTRNLYYDIIILGGENLTSVRLHWSINGSREEGLDRSFYPLAYGYQDGGHIYLTDGSALPRGTYDITILVNDQPFGTASAVIQ